jgi:ABC-type branched-subunit amino acid transport system substrate-binding protein
VDDLGSELITLTIADTAGSTERGRKLASAAMSSGSRVVIGPTDPEVVRHVASLTGKRPPVLALAEGYSGAPGVYPVILTEADSAAAASAWLAGKGKRKFVLFVAEGPDARAIERRVENGLSIHGAKLSASLTYSSSGIDKAVSDMQALVEAPEVVVLATGGTDPGLLASALRSKGYLREGTEIVVTHRALDANAASPFLEGAYVARLGKPETDPFADRFQEKYRYAPDLAVAYAYDTVALSSGLVSALGPDGIGRQTLESKTGFKGATGFFRFRADGSSERTMPLYRIGSSGLKQVDSAVSSF